MLERYVHIIVSKVVDYRTSSHMTTAAIDDRVMLPADAARNVEMEWHGQAVSFDHIRRWDSG